MAQRSPVLAPVQLLTALSGVAILMAAFVIVQAWRPHWLGVSLAYDAVRGGAAVTAARGPSAAVPLGTLVKAIEGGGERMALEPADFTIEPAGGLPDFPSFYRFLDRQSRIARIQNAPHPCLIDAGGRPWPIAALPARPLATLPADFWVQLIVGLVAWLISALIWAFRSADRGARYLLLSGGATLTFSCLAAIYSTRELALPGLMFRIINDLNFLGGTIFSAALVALLLYYPRPIARPWVGRAIVAAYFGWWLVQEFGLFESMAIARRLHVMIAVAATFVLAALQWRLTRRDPVARAALQWFLMSWLVGITIFAFMILLPQMFGIDTSAFQGYSFSLFLLLYVGLALGIARYRLFELGEWWVRVLVWMASVLVLVSLDLLFVIGMELSAASSLALALLACGLLWVPLRGWLWERVFPRAEVAQPALFESVLDVGLARPDDQPARWRALAQRLYDPLEIVDDAPGAAALAEDGLALHLPAVGPIAPLRLRYAQGGRRLFTRRDRTLGETIATMLGHVLASRGAEAKGAAVERDRIASDLHDTVGARLLSALHSGDAHAKDGLIRATLADLRQIVHEATGAVMALNLVMATLRRESADRLAARGIALDWPAIDLPDRALPATTAALIGTTIREAVSNILKHSGATHVEVSSALRGDTLSIRIGDNGCGMPAAPRDSGHGIGIMLRRVTSAGGGIEWHAPPAGGTCLALTLPLGGDGEKR